MQPGPMARKYVPEEVPEEEERKLPQPSSLLQPTRLVLILVAIAVILAIVMAVTREEGILWLFNLKAIQEGDLGDVARVLAPLLALALAIERLIETIFDLFEQATVNVAKLGSAGIEGLQWLQTELDRAWDAAHEAAEALGQSSEDQDKALARLRKAEQRVVEANNRIMGLKGDPKYVSTKRMLSIWIGLLFGLIVAIVTDVGIFELLQIRVPRILDMLVTGFVIGAGAGPMHSLVGLLQGAKDTLENVGELVNLKAVKKRVDELEDKLTS